MKSNSLNVLGAPQLKIIFLYIATLGIQDNIFVSNIIDESALMTTCTSIILQLAMSSFLCCRGSLRRGWNQTRQIHSNTSIYTHSKLTYVKKKKKHIRNSW